MIYPMKFEPVIKETIWGGHKLNSLYGRGSRNKKIGESWDIASHKNGTSIVKNGPLKGKTLKEALEMEGKFPLLLKLIHAEDFLSVQVHPDDEFAKLYEDGELGKTEMWYIIHAEEDAFIYFGLEEGISKSDFEEALKRGQLEPLLTKVPVEEGDVFFIPAGMIHAIGAGIVLCEIQQNSDTTYRVFDYNRPDKDGNLRELHVDKALETIDFEGRFSKEKIERQKESIEGGYRSNLVSCPYFIVDELVAKASLLEDSRGEDFIILTMIEGSAHILYGEGYANRESMDKGDSILIPGGLGNYKIEGDFKILKTRLADN